MGARRTIEVDGPVTGGERADEGLGSTRRAFDVTVVVIATVAGAIALWKLRVVVALLLAAVTISAAMRPGVEWLARHRIPRPLGVFLHYLVLLGLVALFLAFAVPPLTGEVQAALAVKDHAHVGNSIKAKLLEAIAARLHHLPAAGRLIHPALSIGETALARYWVGLLFTFAAAAYWLFEWTVQDRHRGRAPARPQAEEAPRHVGLPHRAERLGAFIGGQLVMIMLVDQSLALDDLRAASASRGLAAGRHRDRDSSRSSRSSARSSRSCSPSEPG